MGNNCGHASDSETETGTEGISQAMEGLEQGVICKRAPRVIEPSAIVKYAGPGPWYTCSPHGEMPPRVAETGLASAAVSPPATLMSLLSKAADERGDADALLVERPVPPVKDGKVPAPLPRDQWTTWTYAEYLKDVRRVAKGFVALGLQQYESVNVWGFNSPEWHMAAIGAMFAGGKSAGLYPTDTPETAAYKVVHSSGGIVVFEDKSKLERLVKALQDRKDCRRLKAFVTWGYEPTQGETVSIAGAGVVPVLSWDALLKLADAKGSDAEIDKRAAATKPGNCAALIYTSGTTGDPKAVMISHDNIVYEAACVSAILANSVNFGCNADEEERILSYLPLSHVAGMMVDIVVPIVVTSMRAASCAAFFARPYDMKEKSIKDRLSVAKPTIFLGVPLVWEKIADTIRALGAQASSVQRQIAGYAKGLALDLANRSQLGGDGRVPWGYSLADKVVLSKIKGRLGLDQCKFAFTGAAPIRRDTLEFFGSLGLQINEVYGMSECTGACTCSTDQAHEWGSVGWEVPGVEVKAFTVDPKDLNKKTECPRAPGIDCIEEQYQGELCFRGRNIMMGYLASPDFGPAHQAEIQQKTAETIDNEGWLHSGDKGMVTKQGMIKITGRYKELIIGEGGENIAPVPIEDCVKKSCDGINEVMMVGDKRKYNVALVTLKAVGANGESPGTDELDAGAKRVNPEVQTISAAINDKVWIDAVTAAITAANKNGQVCPNNAFKIQKFMILPTNFSEEGNELTPTKKLKRKAVETKYAELIDRIYAGEGTYIKYVAA
eukprot:CAMPEP_0176058558 /NCGR_PEP_ID=MMETSP0120_2-20121206/29177_1 /TAXON_ID=160619 /ORGANISM="Kryptoperidinium foliaceum, Strain CCMP 1326" /LENGTH=778 /DNA_ID=CAMNT_0017392087 /DNA_START=74 /DNA_END=2410 /DNA_ORIENTATION=-